MDILVAMMLLLSWCAVKLSPLLLGAGNLALYGLELNNLALNGHALLGVVNRADHLVTVVGAAVHIAGHASGGH
jgi:hypothetical protein